MTTFDDSATSETTWMQWLDLEADGELSADERRLLDQAAVDHSALESERATLGRLHELLAPGSIAPVIEPSSDFVSRVMDHLPQAEWETRSESSNGWIVWQLPVAAMLAFAVAAAFLLSGIDSAILGTGAAIADFFATTALAGAGLLEASWRGMGWGLQQMFADSPATVVAVAGLVLGIDALFVSLLLRRRRTATESASEPPSDS
ncbi:MAG: hypothetical protein MPN21_06045 [Thermoanaerobaculia bacterium]|nr:hypothetical protein [Thermoanaerobaculia bacterium]